MTRGQRVIEAFINCVKVGQYTLDYATTLIEDNQKYGYLTQDEKNKFYEEFGISTVDEATEEDYQDALTEMGVDLDEETNIE